MSRPDALRGLGDIIVSSRPYDEYLAMFDLSDDDVLAGAVLDCPAGAGGFASGVRARGGEVVSVDPAFALPPAELVAASRAGLEHALAYLARNIESYEWEFFDSLEDVRRRRLAALDVFVEDFHGPDDAHVVASLPCLPFPDRRFRLVLSAYLLFSYPDHFDEAAHLAGLRELARVADEEVRIYPLVDTAFQRYPAIDNLRARLLVEGGVDSEIRPVAFRFKRGASEVLVLTPPQAER